MCDKQQRIAFALEIHSLEPVQILEHRVLREVATLHQVE